MQYAGSVSTHWAEIWSGTVGWKMKWNSEMEMEQNSEFTQLQLTHVTGIAQSRQIDLEYL